MDTVRVKTVSIRRLKPAPYNPRIDLRPGDPEYEKLKRSLDTFGCVEPLVWNERTGHVVGGHQRLKVMQAEGIKQVKVSVVDLSLTDEKALNVALNKIEGGWDDDKLAALLQELTDLPDFDATLTGFDADETSQLLDGLLETDDDDDFDLADDLDRHRQHPAITKQGDLIRLGDHRLLCGDSASAEDLDTLLDGEPVDLLFTDPPYNVNYYGGKRPTPKSARPKPSRNWERIYMDNLSQDQYEAWLGEVFANAFEALKPRSGFYIWNGHRQFGPMYHLLNQHGMNISCVITWAKESFAIGYGDYHQQTEFCLYGWKPANGKGSSKHRWYGPNNASTLWQVPRDRTADYRHPTQKPLALAEQALRNSSKQGEVVLDCFLGSGSTLIAAERLKRRCFGMEIDPHYCDAIVRRYLQAANGKAPKHLQHYIEEVAV